MKSSMICTPHQILLKSKNERGWRGEACGPYEVEEKLMEGFVRRPEGKRTL
jgi:hypothetical protein